MTISINCKAVLNYEKKTWDYIYINLAWHTGQQTNRMIYIEYIPIKQRNLPNKETDL